MVLGARLNVKRLGVSSADGGPFTDRLKNNLWCTSQEL